MKNMTQKKYDIIFGISAGTIAVSVLGIIIVAAAPPDIPFSINPGILLISFLVAIVLGAIGTSYMNTFDKYLNNFDLCDQTFLKYNILSSLLQDADSWINNEYNRKYTKKLDDKRTVEIWEHNVAILYGKEAKPISFNISYPAYTELLMPFIKRVEHNLKRKREVHAEQEALKAIFGEENVKELLRPVDIVNADFDKAKETDFDSRLKETKSV